MADSCANKEHLRNLQEAGRLQRKVKTPEQHDECIKRRREADKRQREREKPPRNIVLG